MAIGASLARPRLSRDARARLPGGSLLPWLLPILLLILWQLSLTFGVFKPHQLPPPLTVLETTINQIRGGQLQAHLLATTTRVFTGFLIGSSVALLLGTAIGLSRSVDRAVDPTLQALRTVPTLAWAPLLLLWLGIDEAPKLTLVAIGAFFPLYVNLVSGVRGVDRKLVEVGRVYGLSWWGITRRIILPASLPSLLVGLRLGLSQAWLFVVVAELIAATRGLGFLLTDSQNLSRVDLMLVAMLSLAVMGKLTDGLLRTVELRLLRWRDTLAPEGGTP